MKKVLGLGICLMILLSSEAQNKPPNDTIWKKNGDVLVGKVIEVEAADLKFTYVNESLQYTLSKAELSKVKYASGRLESFGGTAITGAAVPEEDRRNKVAILPFGFIKDGEATSEDVGIGVQNECYALFTKHQGIYKFEPARKIDVLLNKAGITRATIMNYTMDELCKILGVEYIVAGTINMNKTTQTNSNNSSYNNKDEGNKRKDDKSKSTGSSYSYSTSTQNYQTSLDFKIYNDKGETVYNQNRKAFWSSGDAYKNALEYVVKRSPLYTK